MNEPRMNDERIADALERCEKATPGPWEWDYIHPGYLLLEGRVDCPGRVILDAVIEEGGNDASVQFERSEDGVFIVNARADLPDALRDLQDARKRVAELEESLSRRSEVHREYREALDLCERKCENRAWENRQALGEKP